MTCSDCSQSTMMRNKVLFWCASATCMCSGGWSPKILVANITALCRLGISPILDAANSAPAASSLTQSGRLFGMTWPRARFKRGNNCFPADRDLTKMCF